MMPITLLLPEMFSKGIPSMTLRGEMAISSPGGEDSVITLPICTTASSKNRPMVATRSLQPSSSFL